MTDHTAIPDYNLDEVLDLTMTEQFRAIGDPTRQKILGLLSERAATTKQLSEALEIPKGTAGHHLKALEAAGLIRVVRTQQVRALTEKYYGRVARTFRIRADDAHGGLGPGVPHDLALLPLRQAMEEYTPATDPDDPSSFTITHARIPASHARRFVKHLEELSREFSKKAVPGEKVYGFVAGVYLTSRPELPQEMGAADDRRQTTDD